MPTLRLPFRTSLYHVILPRACSRTTFTSSGLTTPSTSAFAGSGQHPIRYFGTSPSHANWLLPKRKLTYKDTKGRPRVNTGGSVRGTSVIWGDYGLRMRDHSRRISAAQFKNGEDVIRRRLRGMNFRLFTRMHTGTAVYTKGNESRMGTGKGAFDYWAARVPVSRIVFELKADVHEQVVKDAFRLAANKLPGLYEFVKKGDPPVVGITKLGPGVTMEDLRRPRKKLSGEQTVTPGLSATQQHAPVPGRKFPGEQQAHRLPGTD